MYTSKILKTCMQCSLVKPKSMFQKRKSRKDGLNERCKKCLKENYKADPEKHREASRRSTAKHKDRIIKYNHKRWQHLIKTAPSAILWYKAKQRALSKGLPFTIKPEHIKVPKRCPVLGIILAHGKGRLVDSSPTVDRIHPERGYIPGNILVVSWRANNLKSNGTLKEFRKVLRYLEKYY